MAVDEFKMTIDQPLLDEYYKYYFEKYPRRKKLPIKRPIHESLNVWSIMQNLQRNNLKQNWKEFIVWWINKYPPRINVSIRECDIRFHTFMPTRRRTDPDNMTPKFILDGFVEAGFLEDDDSSHIKNLILACSYDKENPRTEITFYIHEYN